MPVFLLRRVRRGVDLPKALEADVFGAAEWAIDFLEPLATLATGHERAIVAWRLAANRARFAAEAEKPAPPVPAPPEDALAAERVALLDAPDRARLLDAATAFVAAYEERGGTTVDEVLAAIALHNLLKRDEARAAELFEVAAEELERRAKAGEPRWRESAKSCWYRAMVAHRARGDEAAAVAAKKGADRMGGPGVAPGAFGESRIGQEIGIRPDPGTIGGTPRERDREG